MTDRQTPQERSGWLSRWQDDRIAFHQQDVNPKLASYWPELGLRDAAVFVPLCGKSRDMRFLEQHSRTVVGVELAESAAQAYFADGGEVAAAVQEGEFLRLAGAATTILCGDYFSLEPAQLAGATAAFDRGALVALPPALRMAYVRKLRNLLPVGATVLLLALDYDQQAIDGPPYAASAEALRQCFAGVALFECLERNHAAPAPPRFAGAGIPVVSDAVYRIVL